MLPTIFELLQKSLNLYKKNIVLFLKYVLLLFIPIFITIVLKIYFGTIFIENATYRQIALAIILLFILYLLTLWATITLIRVISKRYNAVSAKPLTKEYLLSKPFVFPSFVSLILMGLAVFGGMVVFFIPGIIFSVWFFFSVYAVILDNKKGTDALHFSKMLVRGRWWEVLALLFFTIFIILGLASLIQSLIHFILTFMTQSITAPAVIVSLNSLGFLFIFLICIITIPLSVCVPTILYNELKKIKNV